MSPAPLPSTGLWAYLATTPLMGLTLTLLVYSATQALQTRGRGHPLLNPVALSILLIGSWLGLSGTPYPVYFEGAQFIHFLLGPATVALAVPLVEQWHRLRRLWRPLGVALLAGTASGTLSAVLIAHALGASPETLASLAPKSVTTPIAMGIAETLGGLPSLTAVLVVCTGIVGASTGPLLLRRLGINDPAICGFALGTAAHGIGTARAFQVNPEMGAFAGLAMGLSALLSAMSLPWAIGPLLRWLT